MITALVVIVLIGSFKKRILKWYEQRQIRNYIRGLQTV